MTDNAVAIAAARRSLTESVGPFVDADTLGTLLDRVAEVPYADDVERYVAVVAEVARATLQPVIDKMKAENAEMCAANDARARNARDVEAFWRMQTPPTIH